jgi:cytochrome c556
VENKAKGLVQQLHRSSVELERGLRQVLAGEEPLDAENVGQLVAALHGMHSGMLLLTVEVLKTAEQPSGK